MKNKMTLVAGLLILFTLTACNKGADEHSPVATESFSVPTAMVASTTAQGYTEVTGTLEGRNVVPVATKLMSQILYMGYEEGDRVSEGDVLARIDDSDIAAMQMEAAAYGAEATAALAEVDAAVAQGKAAKAQAEAGLAQARAALADARADAERFRRLADEDTVPQIQAEKYELALKVAEENVSQAEAAVDQTQAVVNQAESKGPQVQAKQNQAAAKGAQAAALAEYATLTAPFDGVITARMNDPGQLSIPGQPLYMVADDSGYRVVANVAETLVQHLTVGQAVNVVVDDGEEQLTLSGSIALVSAAANPGSHTVRVEVSLDPETGLFSGRFVRVRLPGAETTSLQIPESAIVREGDLEFVWRVSSSGVLNLAPVETGEAGADMVTVIRGLAEGDRVVTEPVAGLYPGARVK